MRIMRSQIGVTEIQYLDSRSSHVDNAVLVLKYSLDKEKLSTSHSNAVSLIEL
jgi:hypothetical protein